MVGSEVKERCPFHAQDRLIRGGEVPVSQDQPGLTCSVGFDSQPGFITRSV